MWKKKVEKSPTKFISSVAFHGRHLATGPGNITAKILDADTGRVIVKNALGIVRSRNVEFGRSAGDEIEVVKGISQASSN